MPLDVHDQNHTVSDSLYNLGRGDSPSRQAVWRWCRRYHAPFTKELPVEEFFFPTARLDFDRYSFGVITCEHNYTPVRDKVHDLLASKGYERRYQQLSGIDDCYVKA